MKTFRTFFKNEIFAEFVAPNKPSSKKALILCDGAPSVPSKHALMEFFCKKGYWVFHIRYRGTWESKGTFLKKSLEHDILDVIDELPRGFMDLWTKKRYQVQPKKIVLFGTSFGGPAVLLASQDKRVDKVIAVSPVVDWRRDGKAERMKDWIPFMLSAYGVVYRAEKQTWNKLLDGSFYNAFSRRKSIDGSKILIISAKDDDIVPFRSTKRFAISTGAVLIARKKGGHLKSSIITQPALWKKISKFLKISGRLIS